MGVRSFSSMRQPMVERTRNKEKALLHILRHLNGTRVEEVADHIGVCSGCVRKPVIATIVQKSKPSRPAYGHTVRLVKSTDFARGFAEPFSDTCLAKHGL